MLLAAIATASALDASPAPGGARDGGRDALSVAIDAYDATGLLLGAAHVDVPAEGMSAYYAMKRSSLTFDTQALGGKSVVNVIQGVASRIPKTAWILFHTIAARDNHVRRAGEPVGAQQGVLTSVLTPKPHPPPLPPAGVAKREPRRDDGPPRRRAHVALHDGGHAAHPRAARGDGRRSRARCRRRWRPLARSELFL